MEFRLVSVNHPHADPNRGPHRLPPRDRGRLSDRTTHILIVEDDTSRRMTAAIMLEATGFSALLAVDAREAMRLLHEQ
jgi:hypothetical protein